MAHKHLHELLREDQEPFYLNNYISDKRCQIKGPSPKTYLQPRKPKPIIGTSTSRRTLCKHACFFSFPDSPDIRRSSPFLDFPSPAKSPCKNPNTVFLHIPARTASLLLEAATRIQKQSSSSKSKTQIKNVGFGLFGSILKRLRDKNGTKNGEIGVDTVRVSAKDWGESTKMEEKLEENMVGVDNKSGYEMGFSCSCDNSRVSSVGWSESNEEKSLDLETSSSCRSEDSEEIEFVAKERENGGFDCCENSYCSSPFRFSLQRSPSSGRRTPVLTPATSPIRQNKEEKENSEAESLQTIQLEEEEEKDQCSPVSVLDPPFEDDEDRHEGGDNEDGFDLESSYAIVQRAKQQLLHKLLRFERLAGLDPIELEKRMLEEQYDEDDNEDLEQEEYDDHESLSMSCSEENADEFVREVLNKSSFHHLRKIPTDTKRLVLDLISEEKKNGGDDGEVVLKRVCKRLDSWKEVERNTIDMMVELEFRGERNLWKRYQEEQGETEMAIELGIFGLLMEELSQELVCLA